MTIKIKKQLENHLKNAHILLLFFNNLQISLQIFFLREFDKKNGLIELEAKVPGIFL